MRSAISPRFVLSTCLLCVAVAGAASAADPAAEPQDQARSLLVGRSFPVAQPWSRGVAGRASAGPVMAGSPAPVVEPAIDGQQQARLLLAGKNPPVSRPKPRDAVRSAAAASDPQEQARRMILGGEFKAHSNSAAVNSPGRVTANMEASRGVR